MIIDPSIKVLSTKVDCPYTLAVLAAKRARQIINGDVPTSPTDKPVSVALHEVAEDKLTYKRPENFSEF